MQRSESIVKLANALALAQGEMPGVKFNSTNAFIGNRYADLGAVISTARPVMEKYGLSIAQLPVSRESGTVGVETVLMHTSGEWISETITIPMFDEKGKSFAQVAGSVISYLRRYSYAAVLGMYADEDTDGSGSRPEQGKADKAGEKKPVAAARPYKPEALREALKKRANSKAEDLNDGQKRLFTALWMEHFAKRDDERHAVQKYLFDEPSLKKVDSRLIGAALAWLKPEKSTDGSGAYVISSLALAELKVVTPVALKAVGQVELAAGEAEASPDVPDIADVD